MYTKILEHYSSWYPTLSKVRRPLVGSVIKEMRIDKGIAQKDFAQKTNLNLSTLKSIENDHQQATTAANLESCAKRLGITLDELILIGRERDPHNCFILKKTEPTVIQGIRKHKRFPEQWFTQPRIRFPDFDLIPLSPPIWQSQDFFVARINLPPQRSISKLRLPFHYPVLGIIPAGFNIRVEYHGKSYPLTTNQGFVLDGFFEHAIINEDEDQAATIYLITKLSDNPGQYFSEKERKGPYALFDIENAIDKIRIRSSDRPGKKVAIKHLADLSSQLDHEQIIKMTRLKKDSHVIYWSKVEDLLGASHTSMEEFLGWTHHQDLPHFSLITAKTRNLIDLSAHSGIKIYSCGSPYPRPQFFAGEFRIEGQKSHGAFQSWEHKAYAMIAMYIEEGGLEITVGNKRTPMPLSKGESIYFDAQAGFVIRNPTPELTRGFIATTPAMLF